MRKSVTSGPPWAVLVAVAVMTVLPASAQTTPDGAAPPAERKANTLKGTVVSKADGRPIAGTHVAMAHAEDGSITIMQDGLVMAHGPSESVLLFFTKMNSRTACSATADEEGRFTLRSFRSPEDAYTVVAAHAKRGVAVMTGVVPDEHRDGSLRIEIDEPAYIRAPDLPEEDDEVVHAVTVGGTESIDADAPPEFAAGYLIANVHLFVYERRPASARDDERRIGPLPGGYSYTVCLTAQSPRTGAAATLASRTIRLKPGQTADAMTAERSGSTVRGHVTGEDGEGLRDVNVSVRLDDRHRTLIGALTDEKGAYKLRGLPPGRHKLELSRFAIRAGSG